MVRDKTLQDLFDDTLQDIHDAERRILEALPGMARAAQAEALREAFETHRAQTERHVARLQRVFDLIGRPARARTCAAVEGILAETGEIIAAFRGTPALDAGLIAAAQAVEHYEIARYGALKRWALALGLKEAVELFDATLREESETDHDLSKLAELSNSRARVAGASPWGRARGDSARARHILQPDGAGAVKAIMPAPPGRRAVQPSGSHGR